MANDAKFGLAAYFYSRDIGRIWRVAEAAEYGIEEFLTEMIGYPTYSPMPVERSIRVKIALWGNS